jgi:hypothetical protein
MKLLVVLALAMLASMPAFAHAKTSDKTADQASSQSPAQTSAQTPCKAFFAVVRSQGSSPDLHAGMSSAQMRWWESEGRNKYSGLCLDGSVASGDKPRYLVVLSRNFSPSSQSSLASNEAFGQTAGALQSAAPKEWIYQPRWDTETVTILYVPYDGNPEVPPVHFATGRGNGFKDALKFLAQEPVFPSQFH